MLLPIIQDFNKEKTSLKKKMADTDQKKRDRKRNFTEPEINVIQDEVEKKFSLLNDKFSTAKANQKKLEVWSNISRMVSALGVAQRTPKECKDKWGNTKKEAKKVYSLARKEQRQTGGGPEIKLVTPAINRTIDLCRDSAAFNGIGGFQTSMNVNLFINSS